MSAIVYNDTTIENTGTGDLVQNLHYQDLHQVEISGGVRYVDMLSGVGGMLLVTWLTAQY